MEGFLIALGMQLLPPFGLILIGLATYGIALLKKKTNSEVAKNALGQVDQIVSTVVGQITQTAAEKLKAASVNGKLTEEQKTELKAVAIVQINALVTEGITRAAGQAVTDLQLYITQKIEEQVLAQKKG